ncbi:YheV family putative zinc ribbon protein [Vibrio taketomensis]|uniref:YheV family putative zinc ribbon protein n=1 Tax=Vibrio taketomensis TaxID=2572923 RepID=UPI0013893E2D|nr:YheV family putative zinc ribbon protein [Vibrio taketomensis]
MKKRFIAGASCPKCQQQDSLRWWIENNIELVECVDCDYHDQRKPQSMENTARADENMIGIFRPS